MSSGKNATHQSGGPVVENSATKYKPWILALVVMGLVTVIWALFESSKHNFDLTPEFMSKGSKSRDKSSSDASAVANVVPVGLQTPGAVGNIQTSYHSIVDQIRPTVISIEIDKKNVLPANQGLLEPVEIPFEKVASGVIIDPRGYVLTSYHRIAGAIELKATLYGPGGAKDYPLKMVKGDLASDMALLRIQGTGPFSHAALGNSDAARTGDIVLSVGSPFGLEQTVTSGIISSRNRTMQVGDTIYENLIQTDSPMNPGSSGGPMINVRGEVIAINTSIFAPTGVFNGIGFAVPINRAANLIGGVVDFNNTTPDVAGGQLVAWTKQGKQIGNRYRLSNGTTVTAPHGPLGACVDCHPQLFEPQQAEPGIGQQIALRGQGQMVGNGYLLPNGQTVSPPHTPRGPCTDCHQSAFLKAQAQIQASAPVALATQNSTTKPTDAVFGVWLIDVTDAVSSQAKLPHPEGALVTNVIPGSAANQAGIQRGDILLRVADRKIFNIKSINALLAKRKIDRNFEVVYWRNGSRKTIKF